MEKVTFEVETITPMFLAGNDQEKVRVPTRNQTFNDANPPRKDEADLSSKDDYSWQTVAELRPSSIRGLMRYWQRAIVGSLAGTNTERMKLVKEAEKQVFGTTELRSTIQIRVKPLTFNILKDISEYDKHTGRKIITGKDYLLFSMSDKGLINANETIEMKKQAYIQNSGDKQENRRGEEIPEYQPPRQYSAGKSTFQVTLSVHGDVPDGKEILRKATAAFWLLANLGGIGSRSRRCAGSIRIKKVENNLTGLLFDEPEDAQQLDKQLKEGIKYIQQLWKTQFQETAFTSRPSRVETASFDVLNMAAEPKSCYIWILRDNKGTWDSVEDAMESIGESLKSYRRYLRLNEKAIFGLPIVVQKKHRQQGSYFKGLYKYLTDARMSSPLLLRISKLQNNKYVGIAVLFKTEGNYVKDMSKRQIKGKYDSEIDDYKFVEKFITDKYPEAVKVEVKP